MALKHFGFVVGAALLAGTACSHSQTAQRSDNTSMNPPVASSTNPDNGQAGGTTNPSDMVSRQKDAIMSQADGSQSGHIRDYSGNMLTLDSAGGSNTVRVDNSVPVFQSGQRVSTDSLVPGADVRVFYKNPTDGSQPQALGIEIVNAGAPGSSPSDMNQGGTNQGGMNQGGMNPGSESGSGMQNDNNGSTTAPGDNSGSAPSDGSTTPNDNSTVPSNP